VVENKCPAFTVTNKCPAPAVGLPYHRGYPVHATRWTYPGEIHSHLKSGQHAGKWPAAWIDGLSRAEAEALHDDDHEGRVRWSCVPGRSSPAAAPSPPPAAVPKTRYSPAAWCPTGT
jgi:hypothetical protein